MKHRPTKHKELQLALVLSLHVVGDDHIAEVDAAVAPLQLPDTQVGFCKATKNSSEGGLLIVWNILSAE